MGRRGDHTFQELSDMILNSASKLLVEEGFQKLSTRKIAASIGYSVGTLYNIFQNLDDIYLHLNMRTLDKLIQRLHSAMEGDVSPPIMALAHAYTAFCSEEFNAWSLLFEYRFPESMVTPKWYNEKIDALYQVVYQALCKSVDITHLQPEIVRCHIAILWAGIHGICALSTRGKFKKAGIDDSGVLVDSFVSNYLPSLLAM